MQIETPCPYCDKLFPQFELASHVASCPRNKNRRRTNAREQRKADRRGQSVAKTAEAPPARRRPATPPEEFSAGGAGAGLVPCGHCGRSFAPDRIGRHMEICQRTSKKRVVFDSASQRAKGQEIFTRAPAGGGGGGGGGGGARRGPKKPSKWRREHREFQNVLRSMNGKAPLCPPAGSSYPGGAMAAEAEESEAESGFVPCPHCGRTFAPLAAERHIPKCANAFARPAPPPHLRHAAAAMANEQPRWQSGSSAAPAPEPARAPNTGGGGSGRARQKPQQSGARATAAEQREQQRHAQAVLRRQGAPQPVQQRRPLTGTMGGRAPRFQDERSQLGGSGDQMRLQAAFMGAGSRTLLQRPSTSAGVEVSSAYRPPSSGGFGGAARRPPSSGGAGLRRSWSGADSSAGGLGGGAGGVANGYVVGQGPIRASADGRGIVSMLSGGAASAAHRQAAQRWQQPRWPNVYQQ